MPPARALTSSRLIPSSSSTGLALARTAEHQARVRNRRDSLHAQLAEIFPTPTRLICEIGCGHGHFLTAYATANPRAACIGIDLLRDRIARATRKRNRAGLMHLHFLVAEASEFLDVLPRSVTLSAIYILFPDPWPKRRHHKHRLLQPSFLNSMAARAEEGTRFYFRTDYEPYFSEAAKVVSSHRHWRLVEEKWPFEMETVFQARAPKYHSFVAVRTSDPAL